MGLDMYLTARRFINDSSDNKAHQKLAPIAEQLLPPDGNYGSISIERDVAYWRKANQIHGWFVTNVQGGEDDCRPYDVGMEQLKELRDTCQRVVAGTKMKKTKIKNGWTLKDGKQVPLLEDGEVMVNPELAKELLPTSEGFFFGSSDYNNWYMDDVTNTINQLDRVIAWCEAYQALSGAKYCPIDFQYRASW